MKNLKKYLCGLLGMAAMASVVTSCIGEEPFGAGEGRLKLKMVLNSTITRADGEDASLADNCIIYLSNEKGLIYKYQGMDEIPDDLYLKTGHYVAEAWAGDSVSASWESKFYSAYVPFDINANDVNQVVLDCKIANVVASVNPSDEILEMVPDYKMTIGHSRATLDYTKDNIDAQGFYMMPDGDTDLVWTLTGTKPDGSPLNMSGTVPDVQRAHEYRLNLAYTPEEADAIGGAIITVTIDDSTLIINENVTLDAAPAIVGVGFDINQPITTEVGGYERHSVYVQSYASLKSLLVEVSGTSPVNLPSSRFDYYSMSESEKEQMNAAGFKCEMSEGDGTSSARFYIEKALIDKLPEGDYEFKFTATDSNKKVRTRTLVIKISNASVIILPGQPTDYYVDRATLYGSILKDDVTNPYFNYRAAGETQWTRVEATQVRNLKGRRNASGATFSAQITGLKDGTRYEYQVGCDNYLNSSSSFFTTEARFVIPNAGFEYWNTSASDKCILPAQGTSVEWWDTGNHGSITLNKNVTQSATSPVHGGSYSACLQSQFVGVGIFGKFAAGNIFAGTYDRTDGTNGELTFGRPFNNSRPVKLRGYVYYKSGTVEWSDDKNVCPTGGPDVGQIYVALTTSTVSIKTKTKELFDPTADYVIAYGTVEFTGEYGSSSNMKEFEITLDYLPGRDPKAGKYIVLTCSASKYGDYFAGGNSVMYIDDLELVY